MYFITLQLFKEIITSGVLNWRVSKCYLSHSRRERHSRARSFGTIPEKEYLEETVFVFFWELFRLRNERNIILFVLLPIAE